MKKNAWLLLLAAGAAAGVVWLVLKRKPPKIAPPPTQAQFAARIPDDLSLSQIVKKP